MKTARFGPAGTADSFAALGYKKTVQLPDYLERFGLTAFEYQCGRGVRVNEATVTELGRLCKEKDIALSLHAPYYISLSSVEEEKRMNSVNYIVDSAKAARLMGADRIIVHSGSCGKISREEALSLAKGTLQMALKALDELGFSDIAVCPETMGKVNQLGDLNEVMELCSIDERLIPCIDFGHLNARTFGSIREAADYALILDTIRDRLGEERGRNFHAHFSKIQYTVPGGEKCHLTFDDREFGPDPGPLTALIAERGLTPRIICESAGTQTEDAAAMKALYCR
ncbi:MAG: TIM barrel protein [Oscillospiraceae bacterium]|nr:TIM barrel protein [Oscillospiraceae bacterium]